MYTDYEAPTLFLFTLVDYSAIAAFEVRQPSAGGDPVIRFMFKNGTSDNSYIQYSFMNSTNDVPLSTFINTLQVRV
jgi:prostatic aicd phosphatase